MNKDVALLVAVIAILAVSTTAFQMKATTPSNYVIANDKRVVATGYRVFNNAIHHVAFASDDCNEDSAVGHLPASESFNECSIYQNENGELYYYHIYVPKRKDGEHRGRAHACVFDKVGSKEASLEACLDAVKDVNNSPCIKKREHILLKKVSHVSAASIKIGKCSKAGIENIYVQDYPNRRSLLAYQNLASEDNEDNEE